MTSRRFPALFLIAGLALAAAADASSTDGGLPVKTGVIEQTPLFSRGAEGLRQAVRVSVRSDAPELAVQATTRCGETELTSAVVLRQGDNLLTLPVPAVETPTSVTVELRGGGGSTAVSGTVLPQRKWTLYIAPSIHTDIGYTDTRDEVFHRHNTNLDTVLSMCRDNPLFKWNVEVAWEIENYEADRPTTATGELLALIRDGRVGLHAGYLNMLTALMSDEAMNRYALYAAELKRKHGLDISSAILTDVPSATWSLPSALAASGVRYFAQGCNQTRGPILRNSGIRAPFWWEGPDGARVLTWLNDHYAQSTWLASAESLAELERSVSDLCMRQEREKYPYDILYVYGAFLDNLPVDTRYGRFLDEWNAAWEYPKLLISTTPEFFRELEQRHGKDLPVRRGDFGGFWEDGAGSTAQETAMHQENQRRITAAETVWAMAGAGDGGAEYPRNAFRKAWEEILFYAEHTWGAAQSISDPDGEMTRRQWADKAQYAHQPDRTTRKLLEGGLARYVSTVPAEKGSLVVVNPLSWTRSQVVTLPAGQFSGAVLRDEAGHEAKVFATREGDQFLAEEVPGFGSRVYTVASKSDPENKAAPDADVLENAHYRIRLEPGKGITSIMDRETGQELVEQSAPWSPGQVVYVSGGDGTLMMFENVTTPAAIRLEEPGTVVPSSVADTARVVPAVVGEITPGDQTPLYREVIISSAAPTMSDIKTHVRLYENEKRIGFDVRITSKTEERRKEGVYVAFPFAMKKPSVRLGMTNAVADAERDFEFGACTEWLCVQDFVALKDPERGAEVVWTSPDAPLVALSQPITGRWQKQPDLTTGTVFSYAMNNYWMTNYKAGQGGDFRFRYDLTSKGSDISDEACVRFARACSAPMLAAVSPGVNREKGSGIKVSGSGVVATTLKPAEFGPGTVLRLRNVSTRPESATVEGLGESPTAIERLNLVEENADPVPVRQGRAEISLKPQETVTLRW